MRFLAAVSSLSVLLLLPAVAAADVTDLGLNASDLDVAMTKDGAAHVAYLAPRPDLSTPQVVKVCRIPAGSTTCTETASKTLPNSDDTTGPWIVTDGGKVVVAVGNANGAENRTYATTSTDGTAAYGPLVKVAAIRATDVELAPSGTRLWISAAQGPKEAPNSGNDYLAFSSAPLASLEANSTAVLGSVPGGRSIGGLLVGITPDGKPLAFLDGNAPDLMTAGSNYKPFTGDPTVPAQVNDASKWGAPVNWDLPDPFQRNGAYDVASASGRMWVAYEGLGRDTDVRQFTGGAFGAATTPDCTNKRFPAGSQEAPDLAITRTNELLITEVGSDSTNQQLGFFHGNADGTAFSPYQQIAAAPRVQNVQSAADPTSDASGVVVWTSDDIHPDQGKLFFARLPAAAFAACPVVTPTPTPTPSVTATPTPTPTPKPTKTVSGTVGGVTLKLTAPNACVTAGKRYKVKLALKKPKKKKLKFRKVTKVVFSATGAKSRKDKKAPYKATLKIPAGLASGTKIKIKAKVTVKLKGKKKTATKTIKTTFLVC